jgi:hypothetical protein
MENMDNKPKFRPNQNLKLMNQVRDVLQLIGKAPYFQTKTIHFYSSSFHFSRFLKTQKKAEKYPRPSYFASSTSPAGTALVLFKIIIVHRFVQ